MSDHSALLAAVEEDHPCTESSCDIAAVIRLGFGQLAANMLCSATNEHAAVDAVFSAGTDNMPQDMRECDDWEAWLAFHRAHGVECESCESFNYGDEDNRPERCGNCLAALPAAPDTEG